MKTIAVVGTKKAFDDYIGQIIGRDDELELRFDKAEVNGRIRYQNIPPSTSLERLRGLRFDAVVYLQGVRYELQEALHYQQRDWVNLDKVRARVVELKKELVELERLLND